MAQQDIISPAIRKATEESMVHDVIVQKIDTIEKTIHNKEVEIVELKTELDEIKKNREPIIIRWRESVKWCLEVDAGNYRYFLKNVAGVYKCVAFKHKVELTADIKNKVAITLSALSKEKLIGRILHEGAYLYGLTKFFTDDLKDLKEEHKKDLNRLIL